MVLTGKKNGRGMKIRTYKSVLVAVSVGFMLLIASGGSGAKCVPYTKLRKSSDQTANQYGFNARHRV